jgi:hypothetical protein
MSDQTSCRARKSSRSQSHSGERGVYNGLCFAELRGADRCGLVYLSACSNDGCHRVRVRRALSTFCSRECSRPEGFVTGNRRSDMALLGDVPEFERGKQ